MPKVFTTQEIIKNLRTLTQDEQRLFRVNIVFINIDKTTSEYEAHKYITVNGRNYRLFDGRNHILPEETINALKDAVGYKAVPKNKAQAENGLNYDDPDDEYIKMKYENFHITVMEDVTPNDLREKLGMKAKLEVTAATLDKFVDEEDEEDRLLAEVSIKPVEVESVKEEDEEKKDNSEEASFTENIGEQEIDFE